MGIDRYKAFYGTVQIDQRASKTTKLTSLFVWLTVICWEIVWVVDVHYYDVQYTNGRTCFCSGTLPAHFGLRLFYLILYFCVQFASLTLICYVYRKNSIEFKSFNLSTQTHCLKERHRLSTNTKSTLMLIPYLVVRLLTELISNVIYVIFNEVNGDNYILDDIMDINVDIFLSNFCIIDMVFAPYIWFRYNTLLKRELTRRFPLLKRFFRHETMVVEMSNSTTIKMSKKGDMSMSVHNYRINPEQAEEILENIWATKDKNKIQRNRT